MDERIMREQTRRYQMDEGIKIHHVAHHNRIFETIEYDSFSFHPLNREVNILNKNRIKASLMRHNFLSLAPLITTPSLVVLDGQHRLEAAKELNISVYYFTTEKNCKDVIEFLNKAKKVWGPLELVKFNLDNVNVTKLNSICTSYALPVNIILVLFFRQSHEISANACLDRIKDIGMPQEIYDKLMRFCSLHEKATLHLERNSLSYRRTKSNSFLEAFKKFTDSSEVDIGRLCETINRKMGLIDTASRTRALTTLEEIYNYGLTKANRISVSTFTRNSPQKWKIK